MYGIPVDKQIEMLDRLLNLTEADRLSWQPHSNFRFDAQTRSFEYTIVSKDADDRHPFILWVDPGVPDRPTIQIESEFPKSDSNDPVQVINRKLEHLYEMVKTKSLGYDEIANDILGDLDSL